MQTLSNSWIRKAIFIFIVLAVNINAHSASYQKTKFGVKTTTDSVDIEIQFYSPSIVRVIKSPEGDKYQKESLSIIKKPQKVDLDITQDRDRLSIKSESIRVKLDLHSGQASFFSRANETLLCEKDHGTKFTDFNDAGNKTYSVQQRFVLGKNEAIYGLGQHQNGKMAQRHQNYYMVQGNTEDAITFFQSIKGYGLFWDNYSPTTFADDEEETSFSSEVGECVDYYFMYGGNADGVIANMRDLTGQVPMFPLWTYGYWQSRERYKSQDETVGVVKKYRELGVPLDGIIQDWQYWGDNDHWNAMKFLNPQFPDPQKMIDDIHVLNAYIIISVWASFGPKTDQYKIMSKKGMLFDFKTWPLCSKDVWPPDPKFPSGVRVYDAFNPEAREIYWDYLNKGIFSLGMDGWWLDSTEPDRFDLKPADYDHKTYLGSYRKVCNAFPLMTVGGVYNRQRLVTSAKRVFILTRSAFAGQQRYGANTWSGDVVASWNALRNQIAAGLNFSLCGIPYWNSDIGGFFLWDYPQKLNDAEYRELYVRWLQFGAFCPMMRSHGTDAPREIYQFGKKGDTIYDAIAKYINLRYLLLPYIYSASWDVTAHQSTMMRALVMDFADDKQALDINNEYMFGKSLLICPVTTPMYSKISVRGNDTTRVEDYSQIKNVEVYLPRGTDWIDFWTGEKQSGGQTVTKETPIDIIPLYVKAGSVIPFGPKVQYATEKGWSNLEIRVYPGANGECTLYEDENDNYNYEKGVYSTINFTWNDEKRVLTISERQGSFPGMPDQRIFRVVIVSPNQGTGIEAAEQAGKVVEYDGTESKVVFQ